jgi:lipid-A-disaccharide synthase
MDGELDRLRKTLSGMGLPPDSVRVIEGKPLQVLFATDYAVVKSGTSTLQAAIARVPMVVVYRVSPITNFLGRLIVKVRHFSLVNNLIDRSLGQDRGPFVRELFQHEVTRENITAELGRLISDRDYRERLREQMQSITGLFTDKSASERVSDLVERLSH